MYSWGKIFLQILLFATIVKPLKADVLTDKCNEMYRANPPEIKVIYNYGKLKYDTGKSDEELANLYKKVSNETASDKIQGLTYLAPHITTVVVADTKMLDSRKFCFYPKEIEIKMWYEPTVYIAKSLKVGSCRFNTVVRHEQTHLDLGHHALYMLAKSIKKEMPVILNKVTPLVENVDTLDGGKSVREMTDKYQEQVKVYFDDFKKNLEKYNKVIDAHENYVAETKLCDEN